MSDVTRLRVGFIGLGRMGQGMANRILGAGHDLIVFNRTPEKATELLKAGALLAPSVAKACEGREIVITMLTDDAALRDGSLPDDVQVLAIEHPIRAGLVPNADHVEGPATSGPFDFEQVRRRSHV